MLKNGVWMVKQQMIENKIEDLFNAIKDSKEYKAYLNIGNVLESDEEINKLINEIKALQKKSVRLEYEKDNSYKEVDKEIEKKVNLLNSKPIYQEYLRRMNNFNDILSESYNNIEEYINSKIQGEYNGKK